LELSPGSGGRGSGGASSCRHVRSSRRRLRNHDAISFTGGAASTTRRRRETSHSTTLSTPRCQGGWRQLEYTRVIISPSAHPRTAGRHAGDPQHGPGPASTPTVQRSHHSRMANRPRYTRAFKGPGAGSAKHNPRLKPTRAPKGWRAGEIRPGTHAASVPARPRTIPTSHEAHLGRQAGERTRAFKLPRHRPATPGPPPFTLGTAGRRVRPSGDTGPTTAHPTGPPQSSRKGKGLSDPVERAGSDTASRSDHGIRTQQKNARHGLHRNC
jgi:hypothetical protein